MTSFYGADPRAAARAQRRLDACYKARMAAEPEPLKEPLPPVQSRPSGDIIERRYERWRLRLKGINP